MIAFFNNGGGSGEIRGRQIANYLGAKLSPKEGYEDDICIYVKSIPSPFVPKHTYIDVVEDSMGLRWVKSHPEVGIIASSQSIYNHLKKTLPNRIILIPQHHCNFKRELRTGKEVRIAGICGNVHSFQYSLDELSKRLKGIGIKLETLIKNKFKDREEVVEFYKRIDIQLIYRPHTDGVLHNPLKLVNAMSFGIPTIAYPEENFTAELRGYFWEVLSVEEMIDIVKLLRDREIIYSVSSEHGLEKAEEYHIDNISKLYLKLC